MSRKFRLRDNPGDDMHRRDVIRRRTHESHEEALLTVVDGPPEGDRWSTYADSGTLHGPAPRPSWVSTGSAAVDHELGIVKTGKEADVFLLRRELPGTDTPETGTSTLLAAKRYRDLDHKTFRRDSSYLEGRNVRESRQRRAAANRTAYGRKLLAGTWAVAEFEVLGAMWEAGAPVPYPVQLVGTELLMEWIGSPDGVAAPRLAQLRPKTDELASLWQQCIEAMTYLARAGLAHGDLSAYNLLVDDGRLVLIDVPQAVDIVANPQGMDFLYRDARNVAAWFTARGLPTADPDLLMAELVGCTGIGG
ncbi:MAG: serine protein kinase RIO [Mycobacteriales bacterium]